MDKIILNDNEGKAVLKLKEVLAERFKLLDIRIFGSKARGEALPDSDIDVMIEIDEYSPEIESAIDDLVYELNLSYDCFISVIIFSKKEIEECPMSESQIYKAIEREGIKV